ncbi:MAG: patatin-like phospholipase family protein [Elusimicrobia bacterium]|nr:patatin-like phospholipase family protein [Elusimicrobiota bacterium]
MDVPIRALAASKIPLFTGLTDEDRALVYSLFHEKHLTTGEILFHQGDPGTALHLLMSGQVKTVQEQNGKTHILATLGRRGDVLGEMALLGGEPRPGTATAVEPTVLLELNRSDFEAALGRSPSLAIALSRHLTFRLMQVNQRPAHVRSQGKVFVLMGALPPKERMGFALNLALSTLEQTRLRVLMVEVAEDNTDTTVAHLSRNTWTAPPMDLQDFQTVEGLRALTFGHASGLDVLSLPEQWLSGRLFGGLYPLVSTARQEWDVVFISLPGRPSRAARALWEDADRTFYVREETAEKGGPLWRELESVVPSPQLDLVELQRSSAPRRNRPGRFYIPWREGIGIPSGEEWLFLKSIDGPIQKGLDRMARHLAGLRIGLAMGSGAALGYSIIGVLRSLERNGVFPDLLAGTSMGALIGSFYAAGRSVDELEMIALSITKKRLWSMADMALPWKGVVVGNGVLRFLKSILGDTTFDQLQRPFACVATDINTGMERVLRHGSVAEAVRASLSLPFFFEPFYLQGRYLVDGGLVNPIPTSIVRAMGSDIILAVNNTTAPSLKGNHGKRTPRPSVFNPVHGPHIFKVMAKTLYTMQYGIAKTGASEADVVITPDMSEFAWMEFHRAADIIKIGEEQTEKTMPKIRAKLPYFADNSRRHLRQRIPPPPLFIS